MVWKRLGRIHVPDGSLPWGRTHASLPCVIPGDGPTHRVLFASRDERNRSHVGALTLTLGAAPHVKDVTTAPLLEPGPLGGFDDHGVYPSCVVRDGTRLRLYFIGWNPGPTQPLFSASIGLAWSDDDGRSWTRESPAPVLGRSRHDPLLATSPCVLRDDSAWRAWYVSGIKWDVHEGKPRSYYHIQHADSRDGIEWRSRGEVAIGLAEDERNVARPSVMRLPGGRYAMWFSYDAGKGYRIGYATSPDGLRWTRANRDHPEGLQPGKDEWENESVEYPCVFVSEGTRYMLYNGNGFGRTGFGLAVWE